MILLMLLIAIYASVLQERLKQFLQLRNQFMMDDQNSIQNYKGIV